MEQSTAEDTGSDLPARPGETVTVTDRVVNEILGAIEEGRIVPGQRMVESELAVDFGVGRNTVREAMQRLAALGFLDLRRNRSAVVQRLDLQETLEVLAVAEANALLMVRCAAMNFDDAVHGARLEAVVSELERHYERHDLTSFVQVRRRFASLLIEIANNREMERIFPTIRIHIIISQYSSYGLLGLILSGYKSIADAIKQNDPQTGAAVTFLHLDNLRRFVSERG